MQGQTESSFLGSFEAFTPGVHFREDERSHSAPITYSSRLRYTMESIFPSSDVAESLFTRDQGPGILFSVNFTSPLAIYEFSNDFRDHFHSYRFSVSSFYILRFQVTKSYRWNFFLFLFNSFLSHGLPNPLTSNQWNCNAESSKNRTIVPVEF